MADDAVSVAPHIYRVLLENARVRVLKIETEPGDTSAMHAHPDMVVYAVSDCTWRLSAPGEEDVEVRLPAGEVFFQEAVTHAGEDVGTGGGSKAIAIELK